MCQKKAKAAYEYRVNIKRIILIILSSIKDLLDKITWKSIGEMLFYKNKLNANQKQK